MVHNRKFLGGALFRDWIRFTLLFRLLPLIHHLLQLIIGDPRVLEGVGGVLVPQLPLRRPMGSSVFGLTLESRMPGVSKTTIFETMCELYLL